MRSNTMLQGKMVLKNVGSVHGCTSFRSDSIMSLSSQVLYVVIGFACVLGCFSVRFFGSQNLRELVSDG